MFLAMLREANPMLGRKQELNLQFLQITDGILMVIAFWVAHALRVFGADTFIFSNKPIGPFSEFQWLLFVILPFGPIVLELQGFYSHPLQKTLGKSLEQIARAIFWLGLIIAACSYFLRLDVPSRAVMPLFVVITTIALLVREHLQSSLLLGTLPQPRPAGANHPPPGPPAIPINCGTASRPSNSWKPRWWRKSTSRSSRSATW